MSDWAITYSKDEATERQVLPFPHKPSPEEVAEHLLEWAEANLKPGHYSTCLLYTSDAADEL
ncbi:hypothetical protein FA067_27095, partial [Pseudomonas aeruginosa]|nr:hypothetical protein [Pseudomonas aeruginosa]